MGISRGVHLSNCIVLESSFALTPWEKNHHLVLREKFCSLPWITIDVGVHSHYGMIQCCTTLYQYNIHIIASCENVLYDSHLHFVKSRGWICTVSVKPGHCALCSRDLNEWQVARAFCPGGLAKPHPIIQTLYRVDFHTGGKGSHMRRLSFKRMVQQSFHYPV